MQPDLVSQDTHSLPHLPKRQQYDLQDAVEYPFLWSGGDVQPTGDNSLVMRFTGLTPEQTIGRIDHTVASVNEECCLPQQTIQGQPTGCADFVQSLYHRLGWVNGTRGRHKISEWRITGSDDKIGKRSANIYADRIDGGFGG